MMRLTLALAFVLPLLLSGNLTAQQGEGKVSFRRRDNVMTWMNANSDSIRLPGKFSAVYESKLSTMLNQSRGSAQDRWYDTVNNSFDMSYDFSPKVDFVLNAKEDWSRDTMSRLGESLFTTNLDGGVVVRPRKGFRLNAMAGHEYDDRFENRDSGMKSKGGLNYQAAPLKGLTLNFNSNAEKSALKRSRDIYGNNGNLAYSRGTTNLSLTLRDSYNKRGYFSDVDRKSIEKRKRQEQNIAMSLERGNFRALDSSLAVALDFALGRKIIDDTANNNESSSKFQNNADGDERVIGLRLGRAFAGRTALQWGLDLANKSNGVQRLSRRRDQTDVQTDGMLSFGIGRADSISIGALVKRTRIDTPDGFANDRDELKLEGGLLWTRDFTESLETSLDFRVMETHYVNIDATQSSQNKWLKTYLLSPSLFYSPSEALRLEHSVSVYANYISFDFEDPLRPRSNLSRRMTSETWLNYSFNSRTEARAGVKFEENDYSLLNTAGEKLPSEEGLKRFGDVSVDYRFNDWLVITPSYIYAIRSDWESDDDGLIPIRREVDQTYGLSCSLFKQENGSIDIGVRRIVRTTRKYPVRIRNYVTMIINYRM